jgi:serine/threonine-protein kinase
MGTPAYMAPEQMRNAKNVDRRCDVYALGIIAFEMATGSRPWGDETDFAMILEMQIRSKRPPDPRELRPDLPEKWAAVVRRALENDPNRRFATARDFALALAHDTPAEGWSGSGMAILERYSRELIAVPSENVTVGRRLPSEVQAPGVPTARERPIGPASVSDGIPGSDGHENPVLTTMRSSAGESVPRTLPPRRSKVLVVGGVAAVAAVAIVIALVATHEADPTRTASTGSDTSSAIVLDASPRTTNVIVDAAPLARMSALAVITEPSGAEVFVDGSSKGASPVNLSLAVGSDALVRAESPGFASNEQQVHVAHDPGTVRLTLLALDAGVPPASEQASTKTGKAKRKGEGRNSEDGHTQTTADPGTGSSSGSSKPRFDPNDVGGD